MERVFIFVLFNAALSLSQLVPFGSTPAPFYNNYGPPFTNSFYPTFPLQNSYFQPTFNPYYNPLPTSVPFSRFVTDSNIDGTYALSFKGADGKKLQESGSLKDAYIDKSGEPQGVQVIKGIYSYTAADGTPIQVSYVVDDNGFRSTRIEIQADEEKATTTTTTEKPEKDDAYRNKILYLDPPYDRYSNSLGYNPYAGNQFGYYSSNRYDLAKQNPFDVNRLRYETYNPFVSSWFNPYVDYNPFVKNSNSKERKD